MIFQSFCKIFVPRFEGPLLTCLQYKSFENTVGKGEFFFSMSNFSFSVFSILLESTLPFSSDLTLLSANSFRLEESKNLLFGKRLTCTHTILTF